MICLAQTERSGRRAEGAARAGSAGMVGARKLASPDWLNKAVRRDRKLCSAAAMPASPASSGAHLPGGRGGSEIAVGPHWDRRGTAGV